MANHLGNEGTVKVNGSTVAEIRSFSISESVDTVEDTAMGDTAKTFQVTQTEWEGSLEVFWDETDTAQTALAIGASVTFNAYPEGASSGDSYMTGTALVVGKEIKTTHNGLVEASLKLKGTGALSKTTV